MTALSAVGAAFSAGAAAVCATAPECNANTAASAAIAISDRILRLIATSLSALFDCRQSSQSGRGCKPEIAAVALCR
jgi:hypothetical protein